MCDCDDRNCYHHCNQINVCHQCGGDVAEDDTVWIDPSNGHATTSGESYHVRCAPNDETLGYFDCPKCGWQFIDSGKKGVCDNCNYVIMTVL